MRPADFPESNCEFGPPSDLDESQCCAVQAYKGVIKGGNLDGSNVVVTVWQPDPEDIQRIVDGAPIFIGMLGGLAPHVLATDFKTASNPG